MRVLLKPKWVAGHLLALTLIVLFVNLGLWQLRRHDWRAERNQAIEAGLERASAPLAELPAGARDYRRTVVRGRYLPGREVLLTPRTEHGPGHHVLTPLLLDDGTVLVVDRGWVPFRLDTPPVAGAAPPGGDVLVEGVLLPASQAGARPSRDEAGRLLRVGAVRPRLIAGGAAVPDVYLLAREQRPPQASLPLPGPLPEPDAGPHLSYAAQWFIFAVVGAAGYPLLLRRALRDAAVEGTASPGAGAVNVAAEGTGSAAGPADGGAAG